MNKKYFEISLMVIRTRRLPSVELANYSPQFGVIAVEMLVQGNKLKEQLMVWQHFRMKLLS
jgi:hypothetical protein